MRSVGTELFHGDRRTDRRQADITKIVVALFAILRTHLKASKALEQHVLFQTAQEPAEDNCIAHPYKTVVIHKLRNSYQNVKFAGTSAVCTIEQWTTPSSCLGALSAFNSVDM